MRNYPDTSTRSTVSNQDQPDPLPHNKEGHCEKKQILSSQTRILRIYITKPSSRRQTQAPREAYSPSASLRTPWPTHEQLFYQGQLGRRRPKAFHALLSRYDTTLLATDTTSIAVNDSQSKGPLDLPTPQVISQLHCTAIGTPIRIGEIQAGIYHFSSRASIDIT